MNCNPIWSRFGKADLSQISSVLIAVPFVGHWRDVTWPDDWTSATADGKRSAQFEHTVVITETGKIFGL